MHGYAPGFVRGAWRTVPQFLGSSQREGQQSGICNSMGFLQFPDVNLSHEARFVACYADRFSRVMSTSYHQEPLPKGPPMFPIPGEVHGPVSVPGNSCLESTYTFVCRFWLIAFEMNIIYYFQRAASMSAAVTLFHKLLAWAHTLHGGVRRDEQSPDHVLNLQ